MIGWRGWLSGGRPLAALVALNVLLGIGLFTIRPPGLRETVAAPPALPAPIGALTARMDGRHRGEPYTLTLTDDDLTAACAYALATSPDLPFADLRVAVAGGRIVVVGTARGAAVGVPVRATLDLAASNGQPVVRIVDLSLGATPLPQFVRQQIIEQANASLDLSRYDLGVTVESVALGEGTLTVRGHLK